MKELILEYINYMKEKYQIEAAMVVGSYVTKKMGPNSDIDIFFVWPKKYKGKRGREYFKNQEFEYFLSPEWKFYDRLRTDKTSLSIYSQGEILYDPEGKLQNIKATALNKIQEYNPLLNDKQRIDYKFWIDTIENDGKDLFLKDDYANFLFFVGSNLPKMNDLLCLLNKKLPVYHKYSSEISKIDNNYGTMLEMLLVSEKDKKLSYWLDLCHYLSNLVGDYDIKIYESESDL